jgi:uncharacterized protein YqhQ
MKSNTIGAAYTPTYLSTNDPRLNKTPDFLSYSRPSQLELQKSRVNLQEMDENRKKKLASKLKLICGILSLVVIIVIIIVLVFIAQLPEIEEIPEGNQYINIIFNN